VPVYPGYVIAIAASVVVGKPVKWIEDRMENLQADSFARDYHIKAELAAKQDGKIRRCASRPLADHGCADAAATRRSSRRAVLDLHRLVRRAARVHRGRRGVHQQPPAAIAYRCSFASPRPCTPSSAVTDVLAQELRWTRPSCA
jgi:carbon-monoxide dehydrogenase large subunit